jgi:hypothetical protein
MYYLKYEEILRSCEDVLGTAYMTSSILAIAEWLSPCLSLRQILGPWESADSGMCAGVCGKARVRCRWGTEFDDLAVHSAWESWGMQPLPCPSCFVCVLASYVLPVVKICFWRIAKST